MRMRLDLAKLLEERLKDPSGADRARGGASATIPRTPTSSRRSSASPLSPTPGQAPRQSLAKAIDGLEGPDARRGARRLYAARASWYEDKAAAVPGRGRAREGPRRRTRRTCEILRVDRAHPARAGRERELVATLRRLAELEIDPSSKRQLFREAKVLAEGQVRAIRNDRRGAPSAVGRGRGQPLGPRGAHAASRRASD